MTPGVGICARVRFAFVRIATHVAGFRHHRLGGGFETDARMKLTYACVLTGAIERLADFYTVVLQTRPTWTGAYAEYATEPGIFCLWSLDAFAEVTGQQSLPTPAGGSVMLEFEVGDVDAEYARLRQLAETGLEIEFVLPPTTMAWGNRSIYVRDPDGNLVNLFTRVI
jgi:catechol 2,3-dioxygenase-like lactoylglutathione lyase family enzyme